MILSPPYLWNRHSYRLQIECAAWSFWLILHYCLSCNSLRYFYFFLFFLFFRQDFVRAISLEPLLAETPNWVCCLVLWSNFALLLTIQFASLFFFFFSRHDLPRFCPGHISGTVTRRDSKLSVLLGHAGLIVHYCLPSNSLSYFFFFFCFFSTTILSGPYLWNRYSQRLKLSVLLGPAV